MKRKKTPWLLPDGKMKSRKEIRKSCKNWSSDIWENYLKTLEVEQQETLLDDPFLIEELSERECDTYQRGIPTFEEFSVLKKYLFEAFRELTDKQQIVLNRTVLEGLGLQEGFREYGYFHLCCCSYKGSCLKEFRVNTNKPHD